MRSIRIPRLPVAVVTAATAAVTALAVLTALGVLTACSGPAPSHPAAINALAKAPPASYYLALGDSLARGVQPNAAGVSVETPDGYPDQVYAALHPGRPGLRLVKLGCPGETTVSMIGGGICRYPAGSQLAAAVHFLQAHRGQVLLVTLDGRLKAAAGPGGGIVGMDYYLPGLAEWGRGLAGHLVAWAAARLAAA